MLKNSGIKEIHGYQCTNCEEIIREVKVELYYKGDIDIQEYVDNGPIEVEEFKHDIIISVTCPECGAIFKNN